MKQYNLFQTVELILSVIVSIITIIDFLIKIIQ